MTPSRPRSEWSCACGGYPSWLLNLGLGPILMILPFVFLGDTLVGQGRPLTGSAFGEYDYGGYVGYLAVPLIAVTLSNTVFTWLGNLLRMERRSGTLERGAGVGPVPLRSLPRHRPRPPVLHGALRGRHRPAAADLDPPRLRHRLGVGGGGHLPPPGGHLRARLRHVQRPAADRRQLGGPAGDLEGRSGPAGGRHLPHRDLSRVAADDRPHGSLHLGLSISSAGPSCGPSPSARWRRTWPFWPA